MTWYGDDVQRSRAIAILNALLGSWGRRGGIFVPTQMNVPKYPVPDVRRRSRRRRRTTPTASSTRSPRRSSRTASATRRCPAGSRRRAARSRGGSSTARTSSRRSRSGSRSLEAIQKLDLLVAIDVLPAEIAGYADVVLPEATYLERWDDVAPIPWSEPFLAIRQQVVPPMYESKPGWWIAKELAKRLDLGPYFPWESAEQMVTDRPEGRRLRRRGDPANGRRQGKARPGADRGRARARRSPPRRRRSSSTRSGWPTRACRRSRPTRGTSSLPTASSGSSSAGRRRTRSAGRRTTASSRTVYSENEVWLNAKAAKEQGLANGEVVTLVNQDGVRSQPVKLKVTQRIRPDCVFVVHGYGHTSPGLKFAKGRGMDDSALVTRVAIDPVAGSTGMSVNFVTIEKTEATATPAAKAEA